MWFLGAWGCPWSSFMGEPAPLGCSLSPWAWSQATRTRQDGPTQKWEVRLSRPCSPGWRLLADLEWYRAGLPCQARMRSFTGAPTVLLSPFPRPREGRGQLMRWREHQVLEPLCPLPHPLPGAGSATRIALPPQLLWGPGKSFPCTGPRYPHLSHAEVGWTAPGPLPGGLTWPSVPFQGCCSMQKVPDLEVQF